MSETFANAKKCLGCFGPVVVDGRIASLGSGAVVASSTANHSSFAAKNSAICEDYLPLVRRSFSNGTNAQTVLNRPYHYDKVQPEAGKADKMTLN